jgi:hypothetical protein
VSRETKRAERDARRESYWRQEIDAATDPAARAAVAFDRARARINRQPADVRDDTWRRIETVLDNISREAKT